MKSLAFCRKNGWLLQNHGLGMDSDKSCEDSATKNTPITTKLIRQICPNRPKHLGYYWKKNLSDVRRPCTRRYLGRTYQCAVVVLVMWQNWVIDIISTLAKTGWPENIDTKSIWGNKSNYRLYIVCWKYNCHNGDQTHYEDAFSFLLLQ